MDSATTQFPTVRADGLPNGGLLPPPSRHGDRLFHWVTLAMAFSLVVLVVIVGWELWSESRLARAATGFRFLVSSDWDPAQERYGALPFIFGTLVSSALGLLLAVPLSIASAIFLTELAPLWIRQPLASLIEMLAGIPSVILGLWGVFVMVPYLRDGPFAWLSENVGGRFPLFAGPVYGPSMLAGGIIIAIMTLPIVTSISREILRSVPNLQRRSRLRPRRDPLGSDTDCGPILRPQGAFWRRYSRPGPGAR